MYDQVPVMDGINTSTKIYRLSSQHIKMFLIQPFPCIQTAVVGHQKGRNLPPPLKNEYVKFKNKYNVLYVLYYSLTPLDLRTANTFVFILLSVKFV